MLCHNDIPSGNDVLYSYEKQFQYKSPMALTPLLKKGRYRISKCGLIQSVHIEVMR